MTVKDLINKLSFLPEQAIVVTSKDRDNQLQEITEVRGVGDIGMFVSTGGNYAVLLQ